jgi:carbon-monoxide dehydrogenase small subunit
MLIAARDIVKRLPRPDENRIRVELAGNLCRCTGYRGIVAAVRSVAETQEGAPATTEPERRAAAGSFQAFAPSASPAAASERGAVAAAPEAGTTAAKGANRFEESFVIRRPPAEVWRLFADLPAVAACLPGAALTKHDEHSAKGSMRVKLGPIAAAFAGSASIERDNVAMRGVIRGAGHDRPSGSRTRGEVSYRLSPENAGRDTRVSVVVEYTLQGMLAQFSRTALVQDLGRRLVGEFAENLNRRFQDGGTAMAAPSAPLSVGRLIWERVRARLRKLIRR